MTPILSHGEVADLRRRQVCLRSSSGNSLLSYSKQVYVRGGTQYLLGNRLLTGTMEVRVPSDLLELVSFVDVSRVWGAGSNLASEDQNQLAAGGDLFPISKALSLGDDGVTYARRPESRWPRHSPAAPRR